MAQIKTALSQVNNELPEVPYPPAPWTSTGQMWAGIFQTDTSVPLPDGLSRLLAPDRAIVLLIRYLEGTLTYDEFVVGTPVRRGLRMGIWVDRILVDSLPSVWGGRRIWGLPKDLVKFTWTDNRVSITDDQGSIATLSVNLQPSKLPAIWMPAPGFGRLPDQWLYTMAGVWAHPGKADLQIEDWSSRFGYQFKRSTPGFSFAAKPFRMNVPLPYLVPKTGDL